MEKRYFYAPDIEIVALGDALGRWYASQGYQAQSFPAQNGGFAVQARKESTLRSLAGMSNALTVVLTHEGDNIGVEVGGAKWGEKALAGAGGLILLGPLGLIGAGVGTYQQSQLQSQTWQFIDNFVRSNSAFGGGAVPGPGMIPSAPLPGQAAYPGAPMQPGQPPAPMGPAQVNQPRPAGWPGAGAGAPPPLTVQPKPASTAGSAPVCSQCGQPLRPGAKFCDNCGAPAVANCPSCGQALRPGAKFCDSCGTPVA